MWSRFRYLISFLNHLRTPSPFGAITPEEKVFIEEFTSTLYSGDGEVVDLGCWLGATTISLAKGLNKNPNPKASRNKIHVFDKFEWENWMNDFVKGTDLENRYIQGENFFDEFKKRIIPWSGQIEVYAVDLCKTEWIGKDIEFILIDAMKSWDVTNGIVNKFYPYLIENKSYILHQDFAHGFTPWIHLIHYRLRNYFRLEHVVPNSGSFVFKYVKKIPSEILQIQYSPCMFSEEEIGHAFEHSLNLVTDRSTQAKIAAAKIWYLIQSSNKLKAKSELDRYLLLGLPLESDLKFVFDFLNLN